MTELQTLAQSELNNLIKYFHKNNLVPNPTKTQYTIFYPRRTTDNPQLKINDTEIERTIQAPLLGIMMQDILKHDQTITKIIRKLQPIIQKFRYANKLLPTHIMKQQYYSLAYPHLIGEIEIWGTDQANNTQLQPLIRTQKKLIGLVKILPPRTHTLPLKVELEILGLPELYTLRTSIGMHEHVYPQERKNRPEHNHSYIETNTVHSYSTRHSQQATLHQTYDMNHFTKKYTKIWNGLPKELRETKEIGPFKRKLTRHLLDKQIRDLNELD